MNLINQDSGVIGTALVFDKQNKSDVKIYINKDKKDGELWYLATIIKDEKIKKIGAIRFQVKKGPEGLHSGGNSAIWIARIDSFEKDTYRGVGTALMQAVIERSWKNTEGGCADLSLSALVESVPFYWKLGMKSVNGPLWDKAILRQIERAQNRRAKKYHVEIGGIQMYFPNEEMQKWKEKILLSPVLYKTQGWLKNK